MSIDNAAASSEEIARGVSQYDWYHRIDLGHGIITPGEYDLEPLLPHYGIPDSLEGKDVPAFVEVPLPIITRLLGAK